jgi:hypothetical protein
MVMVITSESHTIMKRIESDANRKCPPPAIHLALPHECKSINCDEVHSNPTSVIPRTLLVDHIGRGGEITAPPHCTSPPCNLTTAPLPPKPTWWMTEDIDPVSQSYKKIRRMTQDFHEIFSHFYHTKYQEFSPDEVRTMIDILQLYAYRSNAPCPVYRLPFFEVCTAVDEFCMLLGADVFLGNKRLRGSDEAMHVVIPVKARLDQLCRRMGIQLRIVWSEEKKPDTMVHPGLRGVQ